MGIDIALIAIGAIALALAIEVKSWSAILAAIALFAILIFTMVMTSHP